jgi:hypothetical protein
MVVSVYKWTSLDNGSSCLRLGAFFSDASGLMVRLVAAGAGDWESRGASSSIVEAPAKNCIIAIIVFCVICVITVRAP